METKFNLENKNKSNWNKNYKKETWTTTKKQFKNKTDDKNKIEIENLFVCENWNKIGNKEDSINEMKKKMDTKKQKWYEIGRRWKCKKMRMRIKIQNESKIGCKRLKWLFATPNVFEWYSLQNSLYWLLLFGLQSVVKLSTTMAKIEQNLMCSKPKMNQVINLTPTLIVSC